MKFTTITLFPEMFDSLKNEGVISRAIKQKLIEINPVQLRDFAQNPRKNVDDHPAGGGDGMVIQADIAERALLEVQTPKSVIILTTPRGKLFNAEHAKKLAKEKHLIFLCGRYAGFDERFIQKYVHLHFSIGDFVLSGGELPAMCMIDSIARFVPGTLGNEESPAKDSFEDGLLEAPCYTKPQDFHGEAIPSVLMSGNHKKITEYKRIEQLKVTAKMRPDLIHLQWNILSKQEKALVEKVWKSGS